MAFFTPYDQEAPVDLSMASMQQAQEAVSPDVEAAAFYPSPFEGYFRVQLQPYPQYGYYAPQPPSFVYPYGTEQTVPLLQISPESAGSSSSVPQPPAASWPGLKVDDSEHLSDDEEYKNFERAAFDTIKKRNGGSLLGTNPRMRRAVQTSQAADDSYKKQRLKNNMAAKHSRDRRKIREMSLECQVKYLRKKLEELQARRAGPCERCGRLQ